MTGLTMLVAMGFTVACLLLRPGRAVGVFVMALLLWPEYMAFEVGPADLTTGRVVAMALFARFLMIGSRRFRPGLLDCLVLGGWAWELLASVIADASSGHLTYLIGRSLDTVLVYFVARLGVQGWDDLRAMFLPIVIGLVVVVPLALMENVTSSSVYDRFYRSRAWAFQKDPEYRLGLMRARASAAHYIYFGMTMVFITGFLYGLRRIARPRWLWPVAMIACIAGLFSSLSSGPWMAAAMFFVCAAFYVRRDLIKPCLISLALLAVFMEFASNRHFYELIDYFALRGRTAWYRTRLLEVAVAQLHEYWAFGFGSLVPNHWGALIDGRGHVDLVNNYVLVATRGGLLALAIYVAIKVRVLVHVTRVVRAGPGHARFLAFALGALTVAIAFAEMSVGLFAVPLKLYYMSMAVAVAPALQWSAMHRRVGAIQRRAAAERLPGAVSVWGGAGS